MPPNDAPPVREQHVAVAGARLFVREAGAGTPLMVLHGGPDFDHAYLLPELDRLADGFRLVYYDQRGRGRSSDGVAAEDVDLESDVADIDALRRHFGFETLALLGHSWGCLLALEYAARHAERVSHLVLMNPAPASHADMLRWRASRETKEAGALARMQAIAATPAYAAGDIAAEAEYYRIHFAGAFGRADGLERIIARLRTHCAPHDILKARAIEERLYGHTWQRTGYDATARLRAAELPTLVIHGDRDLTPVACARRIAEAIPRARCEVLQECGHFAYLDRPDDVQRLVGEFVTRA
jgi:proline iminopeptidase